MSSSSQKSAQPAPEVQKSEAEWRKQLTPEAYHVTREHGTERPFSHPYNSEKSDGMYTCVCCGAPLFGSDAKFDSGTGWPSFDKPADGDAISEISDTAHGMRRTEVRCAQCEAHLGHVFPDGPTETGQRYCINGAALELDPSASDGQDG